MKGEEGALPEKNAACGGTLYLVSVPIGNLSDMTPRALDILKTADVIASEEVQVTRRLLASFNIEAKLISYRESNRDEASWQIIGILEEGKSVALVTGAGTPCISDPGMQAVSMCHEHDLKVVPVPGVSALTAAAAACGLPCRRFCFEGFLPRTSSDRRKFLQSLAKEERTLIFFEAPHRLKETLADILKVFGNRRIFLGRELTKHFEECRLTYIEEALNYYESNAPRGEFALVIEGSEPSEDASQDADFAADAQYLRDLGLPSKTCAEIMSRFRNISRNDAKKLFFN